MFVRLCKEPDSGEMTIEEVDWQPKPVVKKRVKKIRLKVGDKIKLRSKLSKFTVCLTILQLK